MLDGMKTTKPRKLLISSIEVYGEDDDSGGSTLIFLMEYSKEKSRWEIKFNALKALIGDDDEPEPEKKE